MSNRKDMIIHLITGLIKKATENKYIKKVNTFLNYMNLLDEPLTLKLIYLIILQKQN